MNYVLADLGVSTADSEQIEMQFQKGDLTLSFLDWQEKKHRLVFKDALAFRWQDFDDLDEGIRDDVIYEVVGSQWLSRQSELQGVEADQYVHYKLCFNARGTLDVLAKR